MKTRHLVMFFSLFFALCTFSSEVQAQSSSIKGQVVDSLNNETIPYATIKLFASVDDKKPLKAQATDDNGKFTMNVSQGTKFVLAIEYIGKTTKYIDIDFTENSKIELNKIDLLDDEQTLGEVVVTAQKPLVRVDLDKISYSVQDDPESEVINALDMLKKVPLITVDGEDKIELKGSTSFKIYMNGKPSPMIASSPKDVLKSMPANTIKDIEVITDPGAKYDAEGVSGIINIITHSSTSMVGYTATMRANVDSRGGFGFGGYATVKAGKFGVTGNIGQYNWKQPKSYSSSEREYFDIEANQDRLEKYLDGTGFSKNRGNGLYGHVQLSYELDTLNLFNFSVSGFGGSYKGWSKSESKAHTRDQELVYNYINNGNHDNSYGGPTLGFDYQRTFANNKDRLLTFSYQYSISPDDSKNYNIIDLISGDLNNLPEYLETGDVRQNTDAKTNEHTAQADFVTPFAKMHSIEAGLKYIRRTNESESENMLRRLGSDDWIQNPSANADFNDFKHISDIYSIYAGYNLRLKKWGVKTGVRYEGTKQNAKYALNKELNFKTDFNDFVPSATITYQMKPSMTLRFGYNMRIQRPGIWQLNPYENTSDPNLVVKGNPNLEVAKSHSINTNYLYFNPKLNINLNMTYSFGNNDVERVYNIEDRINTPGAETKKTVISTYENIGKRKNLNLSAYVNWSPNQNFRLYSNMSGGYTDLRSNDELKGYHSHGFTGRINAGIQYKLPWNIWSGFNGGLFSPSIGLQSKGATYYYHSFSLRKTFKDDRINVSVYASSPFKKENTFKNRITSPTYYAFSRGTNVMRSFGLSVSFRIGKLSTSIKKAKRGIENTDMSSGGGAQQGGGEGGQGGGQ